LWVNQAAPTAACPSEVPYPSRSSRRTKGRLLQAGIRSGDHRSAGCTRRSRPRAAHDEPVGSNAWAGRACADAVACAGGRDTPQFPVTSVALLVRRTIPSRAGQYCPGTGGRDQRLPAGGGGFLWVEGACVASSPNASCLLPTRAIPIPTQAARGRRTGTGARRLGLDERTVLAST